MNIQRVRLPWHRRYNWRIYFYEHKRMLRLFFLMLIVGVVMAIGEWMLNQYIDRLESEYQKVSMANEIMSVRMIGAPKTPEDHIELSEINWKKLGWKE